MKTYLKRLWRAVKGQDHEMQDLRAFNRRYHLLDFDDIPDKLSLRLHAERFRYLLEEATEFRDAVNLADMADALVDIVYIAKGTARMMGLPWEELWDDAQRANMAKEPAATARSPRDVVKPVGWAPPNGSLILDDHGAYRPEILKAMQGRDYPEFIGKLPVRFGEL